MSDPESEFGTIHEVLTRENPPLVVVATSKSITNNLGWKTVNREDISEWKDFTYANLENGWGHLLKEGPVRGQLAREVTNTQRKISSEDKVDTIAEAWNIKAVRGSIKRGAEILRGSAEPDISIGKRDIKFTMKKKNDLIPDMAVFLQDSKETCLLVGDNKLSVAWSYETLMADPVATNRRPINQITTYCVYGGTRYGYIMSDDEVVACRLGYVEVNGQKKWKIECRSIPWSASGDGVLTINLAIWWLSMMAVSEEYRAIKPRHQMMPINHWWEHQEDGKTSKYTVR